MARFRSTVTAGFPGRGDECSPRSGPAVLSVLVVVAGVGSAIAQDLRSGYLLEPYKAPVYWVGYGGGPVRRGLPGAVLGRLVGDPSTTQVVTAAVVVSALGVLSFVLLSRYVARGLRGGRRYLAVALVVASPFTIPLLVVDVGRYDAIGVLACLVLVVLGRHGGRSPVLAHLAAATTIAAATASEEFLWLFLAPVAVGVAAAWGLRRRAAALSATAMLLPGLVVGIVTTIGRPEAYLAGRAGAAFAAGVARPDRPGHDAATFLGADMPRELAEYALFDPVQLGLLFAVLGVVAVLGAASLRALVGVPTAYTVGVWLLICVLALSLIGIDVRRWWALAYLSVLGLVAVQRHRRTAPEPSALVLSAAALLAGVPAFWAPIGPQGI